MSSGTVVDPDDLDKGYKPFPDFSLWQALQVDLKQWDQRIEILKTEGTKDPALLSRARDVAKRAAAIDTGAIEDLYTIDSGFTITVAMQVGVWRATFEKEKEETRKIIESQLAGYDQVIDFATRQTPMIEVWLRGLHKIICAEQKTYKVRTEHGIQDQELPLGEYKRHPNHVVRPDGNTHSYAPVHQTEGEMRRLLEILNSKSFLNAHPVIQAAYAHYALVWIHPFADGNGRTARALASVYTYRSASIPYTVLLDHKKEYLDSLRAADSGAYQSFVDFAFRRAIETFGMIQTSLRAARYQATDIGAEQARKLHFTRGGYTHQEIDSAGEALCRALAKRAQEYANQYTVPKLITFTIEFRTNQFGPSPSESHRPPRSVSQQVLNIRIESAQPAQAQTSLEFCYYVPIDAGPGDFYIVNCAQMKEQLHIPIENALKSLTTVALLNLSMFLDGLLGGAYEKLIQKGRNYLRQNGY